MKFAAMDEVGAGSKAQQLKAISQMGYEIAPFFVLTNELFDSVLEANDAKTEMGYLKTKLKNGNELEIFERMANLVSNFQIPAPIGDELYKRYLKLGSDPGSIKSAFDLLKQKREAFVAVRAADSNPYLDTYTNIKGKEELLKAVKLCWMSFFSAKAYDYRLKHPAEEPIALIVQKMVLTQKAGEVDCSESGIYRLKAFWGQTGFISKVSPDIYIVSNTDFAISSKTIGLQKHVFLMDKQKQSFVKKGLPPEANESQVLEDEEVIRVAKLAHQIIGQLGQVSVEFGFSQSKVFIINVRYCSKQPVKVESEPSTDQVRNVSELASEPKQQPFPKEDFISDSNESELNKLDFGEPDFNPPQQTETTKEPDNPPFNQFDEPFEAERNFHQDVVEASMSQMGNVEDTQESGSPGLTAGSDFIAPQDSSSQANVIDEIFEKFITINPNLKSVLELLKDELKSRF